MFEYIDDAYFLVGPRGRLPVSEHDEITRRLAMLYEGECEEAQISQTARKFGYSRQRYYQLLELFKEDGAEALAPAKRGPKGNYRRTDEVVRQIIRHRFLDPDSSPEVIAQKLRQCGYAISASSVKRVIAQFGLQKKTSSMRTQQRSH